MGAPLPETKRKKNAFENARVLGRCIYIFGYIDSFFLQKGRLQMSLEVHSAQKQRRKETMMKGQSKVGRGSLRWEFL